MKPRYIQEIEENLGLECLIDPATLSHTPVYWVMSPSGVAMFQVGGSQDGVIGMCSQPDMYEIQGIGKEERSRRRRDA